MILKKEFKLEEFEPWSGAVETKETIIKNNKSKDFEYLVDKLFYNGATQTQINDFLWFEDEFIFNHLNIETDEEQIDPIHNIKKRAQSNA